MCCSDAHTHVRQRTQIHVCVCTNTSVHANTHQLKCSTPASTQPCHHVLPGTGTRSHARLCPHCQAAASPTACVRAPTCTTHVHTRAPGLHTGAPKHTHAAGVCRQARAHGARAATRRQQAQNPHVHGSQIPQPRMRALAQTHTRQRAGHSGAGGARAGGGLPTAESSSPAPCPALVPMGRGVCVAAGGQRARSGLGTRTGWGWRRSALLPAGSAVAAPAQAPTPQGTPPAMGQGPSTRLAEPHNPGTGTPRSRLSPPPLSHGPATTAALSDSPCCWGGRSMAAPSGTVPACLHQCRRAGPPTATAAAFR